MSIANFSRAVVVPFALIGLALAAPLAAVESPPTSPLTAVTRAECLVVTEKTEPPGPLPAGFWIVHHCLDPDLDGSYVLNPATPGAPPAPAWCATPLHVAAVALGQDAIRRRLDVLPPAEVDEALGVILDWLTKTRPDPAGQ